MINYTKQLGRHWPFNKHPMNFEVVYSASQIIKKERKKKFLNHLGRHDAKPLLQIDFEF